MRSNGCGFEHSERGEITPKASRQSGLTPAKVAKSGEAARVKFDIQGRIRNMRLPNGRTALLYSIYEAVSNGIHAIEERFGSDTIAAAGLIGITVALDESKDIASLTIRDNGIGLNPRHLTSFETCDTLEKSGIGGRGVGRLVWLKAFSTVSVSSTHAIDGGAEQVTFRFDPHKDDSLACNEAPQARIRLGRRSSSPTFKLITQRSWASFSWRAACATTSSPILLPAACPD
jgi:hypothetical protein